MKDKLLIALLGFYSISNGQTVTTFAGIPNDDPMNKYESSSGVSFNNTYFSYPEGICFDPNGVMYISERNKIRIVVGDQLYIRGGHLSGPYYSEGYKNANGTGATFRNPAGIVADNVGNVYVADKENHCIRKMSRFVNLGNTAYITTFAGSNPSSGLPGYGNSGSADGTGAAASFNQPTGIARDNEGYFYVTDYGNYTIRKISPGGVVTTLAGTAGVEGTTDGSANQALFGGPCGVAVYDANHIVVTDPWNTNIRKINIYSGETTTLAGPSNGADARQVDGSLAEARFKSPKGIVVFGGIIYVTDQNLIRAIDVGNNAVTTFAGNKNSFSITDGSSTNAAFTELSNITSDGKGNLYVTESSDLVASSVIRKIAIENLAPIANFSAAKRNVAVNEVIKLSDVSTGAESTNRLWTISPSSFQIHSGTLTSETIDISFKSTGFYAVNLELTNQFNSDSKYTEAYFSVSTTGNVQKIASSDLISIYPNPANEEFTLKLDASLTGPQNKVELFDITGKLIEDITGINKLNTTGLQDGVYFVKVSNDELKLAKRIVISH